MPWWAPFLLFQLPSLDIPATNPFSSPADVAHGQRLYMGRCAGCHGPTGDGGKGANLAAPRLARAADDRSLYRIIRYGIPDTEMPGSLMDSHEIWQTAAFVRSLGQVSAPPATGNPVRGEQILREKGGCLNCHSISGHGGVSGPDLSGIGARRSANHLRNKLLDPASDVPHQFRAVQLTTRSGQTIRGIRVNEDTWSIQLRDFGGRFHSLFKDELAQFTSERKTTMPAYRGTLSDDELNDLVAFLSSQRGAE
jgi:putative heme-binding domain-containing protein